MRARRRDELLDEVRAEAALADDERVRRRVVRIEEVTVLEVERALTEEPRRRADAGARLASDPESAREGVPEIRRADLCVVVAREEPQLAAAIDVLGERGAHVRLRPEGRRERLVARQVRHLGGEIEEIAGHDDARAAVRKDERGQILAERPRALPDEVEIREDEGAPRHGHGFSWTTSPARNASRDSEPAYQDLGADPSSMAHRRATLSCPGSRDADLTRRNDGSSPHLNQALFARPGGNRERTSGGRSE